MLVGQERRRSRSAAGRGWPPWAGPARPSASSGSARRPGRPRRCPGGPPTTARRRRPCTAAPGSPGRPGRGSRPRCGAASPAARRPPTGSPRRRSRTVGQGAVGGGVVLHVHGDRGADRGGGLADLPRRVQRDLVRVLGQALPQRGQLDRHLDPVGQALGAEPAQQGQVGVDGGLGLGPVGGVLAEVVDGDQAVGGQPAGGRDGVVVRRPRPRTGSPADRTARTRRRPGTSGTARRRA